VTTGGTYYPVWAPISIRKNTFNEILLSNSTIFSPTTELLLYLTNTCDW